MPFGSLGIWEVLLILLMLLLVFGAKRLPELGGALGKGIREFKKSVRDIEAELNNPADDDEKNAGEISSGQQAGRQASQAQRTGQQQPQQQPQGAEPSPPPHATGGGGAGGGGAEDAQDAG